MSAELLTTLQSGPETGPAIPGGVSAAIGEQVETPHIPDVLSILPLRAFVIFPGTVAPLNVRRPASIKLLDETLPQSKVIGLVAQRDESKEEPGPQDLYEIGCAAIVLKLLRQADDHVIAIVQGLRRFALRKIVLTHPYLRAQIALLNSIQPPDSKEWQAAFRNLRDSATRLLELTPDAPDQASLIARSIENPEQLVDFLAPNLNVDVAQKQAILEELDVEKIGELPLSTLSEDNLDLDEAQKVLDRDHYDLEKVKRRLIEFLAVHKLNPQGHGPILCFLGPPGVGKTSLGQSIADALGRKFVRMSLGGIRDEAEIRGHRRTYIGSMPGRIIQELRRAGTRNPVMMLDEIDKVGTDFRGDPASALLEVLDPRQNNAFVDRYLDIAFDLSQVIFIATANYAEGIPGPLLDRMELIDLPGYTEREKLEIGKRYLLPRQLSENGLKSDQVTWDEEALRLIITDYTHEAGVRELERQIGAVCRALAARVARGTTEHVEVTVALVRETLGPARYVHEQRLTTNAPGVVTGLAYTPTGGEILHIEAARYAGKGNITLTGQIGNVMKESAQAALSLVRSRDGSIGVNPDDFRKYDIHVHVPAGAVPKDGPSAGVAMFTALASLFTNTPVRSDVAMTGEITLRGLVLPIGGLKEKSLAAMRAGISTVLIPKLNEKDLVEIPEEAKQKLKFVAVETVDEVLANALDRTSSDQRPSQK